MRLHDLPKVIQLVSNRAERTPLFLISVATGERVFRERKGSHVQSPDPAAQWPGLLRIVRPP